MGLIKQDPEKHPTISISVAGTKNPKENSRIHLTRPSELPKAGKPKLSQIACDEISFDKLRKLRKPMVDEQEVPPNIIFGDSSLRQMAKEHHTSDSHLPDMP